jgi:protein tyrosine phosphatase (PTP) superfamily phosphohydrolase (DUF442 family)
VVRAVVFIAAAPLVLVPAEEGAAAAARPPAASEASAESTPAAPSASRDALAESPAGPEHPAPPDPEILPNFHRVTPFLYRGGQPREGGIAALLRMGVRTIVNLRTEAEEVEAEAAEARAAGLRFISVPMSGVRRPKDETVEWLLGVLLDPANHPVFVHCKRGADRTGTLVACYRMVREGWPEERAREEAKRHGLAWWQFRMKGYIEDACGRGAPEPGDPAGLSAP